MALLTTVENIPLEGDKVVGIESARDAVWLTFKSGKKISFHTDQEEVDLDKIKNKKTAEKLLKELKSDIVPQLSQLDGEVADIHNRYNNCPIGITGLNGYNEIDHAIQYLDCMKGYLLHLAEKYKIDVLPDRKEFKYETGTSE